MTTLFYDSTARKKTERVFHAISFEILATLICAPLFAYLMNQSLWDMGALTMIFALIAMFWNILYNILFDRVARYYHVIERTFWIRLIHALCFEIGLIVISVPIAAWWLNLSLLNALIMDIGILLFFLPYTIIFNWVYDTLRKQLWLRRQRLV